jgi:ionotropic glutamate receptor
LAVDISTAILQMSENGHLQQLHDFYLNSGNCDTSGSTVSSNELGLDTFWGLFLITGVCSVLCVLLYWTRLIRQHHKRYTEDGNDSDQTISRSDRRKSFLKSLVSYIEEAEISPKVRDDGLKEGNSSRKGRSSKKGSMESCGNSARTEDGGSHSAAATAPSTPERMDNPY